MTSLFTLDERSTIIKDINNKYYKVAENPTGHFRYPTGREALEKLSYCKTILDSLPDSVASSYCGTGNPFSLAEITKGEVILDFGCGAGVDTIFASKLTGDEGRVVGLDIVPEMLLKAKSNKTSAGISNIEFLLSLEDSLPFEDNTFDSIISNSVINLVPEKEDILKELYRCLKPGGKIMLVDQIFIGKQIKEHSTRVKSWFQ